MSGRGPAPKDPEQRRRRNSDGDFDTLPAEGYKGEFPALPDVYEFQLDDGDVDDEPLTVEIAYRDETREWYEDWARSPMATRFTKTDWNRLRWVVAPLFDQYVRRPSTKLAAELRLQETLLGATMMDRQRMRQRIGDTEPGASKPRASSSAARRRQRLRAV